jgi:hypothetical protein
MSHTRLLRNATGRRRPGGSLDFTWAGPSEPPGRGIRGSQDGHPPSRRGLITLTPPWGCGAVPRHMFLLALGLWQRPSCCSSAPQDGHPLLRARGHLERVGRAGRGSRGWDRGCVAGLRPRGAARDVGKGELLRAGARLGGDDRRAAPPSCAPPLMRAGARWRDGDSRPDLPLVAHSAPSASLRAGPAARGTRPVSPWVPISWSHGRAPI